MIGLGGNTRRSLAGTTILQLVPALRDDPPGRGALDIALAVLQSGARTIVAGGKGSLVDELCAGGGEWLPMHSDTFNPLRIRLNAHRLAKLIASERVDIVHAQSAGAAWSAIGAIDRMPVFLITSFPDRLPADCWPLTAFHASLARGDRVIAPSGYVSRAMIARYKIAPDRLSVIPRAVDTAKFSPAAVSADRVASLRRAWGVPPQTRVVLVPGRIAPPNGQLSMIDAVPRSSAKAAAISPSCSPAMTAASGAMRRASAAKPACTASTRSAAWSVLVPTCRPRSPPPTWWRCRRWNRR